MMERSRLRVIPADTLEIRHARSCYAYDVDVTCHTYCCAVPKMIDLQFSNHNLWRDNKG